MKYTRLGRAGIRVSRICMGCMTFGTKAWRDYAIEQDDATRLVARALELGINYFDTADFYSLGESEKVLGAALKAAGVSRDQVVISSKVGLPVGDGVNDRGLSRKHIRHAIEGTLRRLGTDYIDVYQIHRFDPLTPAEEVVAAFDDLVSAGKALYLGASTMRAWQFVQLLKACDSGARNRFTSMQLHYNLIYREEEREAIPLCRAEGVAVLPWSPLARGMLARPPTGPGSETARAKSDTTAHRFYDSPTDADVMRALSDIAEARGATRSEIALAWLMHKPGIASVLVGTSTPAHVEAACRAVDIALTDGELRRLEAPYGPHAIVEHDHTPPSD